MATNYLVNKAGYGEATSFTYNGQTYTVDTDAFENVVDAFVDDENPRDVKVFSGDYGTTTRIVNNKVLDITTETLTMVPPNEPETSWSAKSDTYADTSLTIKNLINNATINLTGHLITPAVTDDPATPENETEAAVTNAVTFTNTSFTNNGTVNATYATINAGTGLNAEGANFNLTNATFEATGSITNAGTFTLNNALFSTGEDGFVENSGTGTFNVTGGQVEATFSGNGTINLEGIEDDDPETTYKVIGGHDIKRSDVDSKYKVNLATGATTLLEETKIQAGTINVDRILKLQGKNKLEGDLVLNKTLYVEDIDNTIVSENTTGSSALVILRDGAELQNSTILGAKVKLDDALNYKDDNGDYIANDATISGSGKYSTIIARTKKTTAATGVFNSLIIKDTDNTATEEEEKLSVDTQIYVGYTDQAGKLILDQANVEVHNADSSAKFIVHNVAGNSVSMTDSTVVADSLSIGATAEFTVGGESTLKIANLSGTINVLDNAVISDSSITGGKVVIADENDVVFDGEENSILSTITNNGNITVNSGSTLTATTINNNGTLTAVALKPTGAVTLNVTTFNNAGTFTLTSDRNGTNGPLVPATLTGTNFNATSGSTATLMSPVLNVTNLTVADDATVTVKGRECKFNVTDLDGTVAVEGATIFGSSIGDNDDTAGKLFIAAKKSDNSDNVVGFRSKTEGAVTTNNTIDVAIENNGTISLVAGDLLTANGGITGNGRIVISGANAGTGDDDKSYHLVAGSVGNLVKTVDGFHTVKKVGNTDGLWLSKNGDDILYVSSAYTGDVGTIINNHIVGYNAFGNLADAMSTAKAGVTIQVDSANSSLNNEMLSYVFAGATSITTTEEDGVIATIGFKDGDNGLMLNPAASVEDPATAAGTLTIGEKVTIKTTGEGEHDDNGAVYLNFDGTDGKVIVNGNIDAWNGIKIYGETEINGNLTVGTSGKASNIVIRSGKAAPHAKVTFGEGATITGADWFRYISGDVVTNNAAITVAGIKYDNQWSANTDYDTTAATLTSNGTKWTIGAFEAAGDKVTKAAMFSFNGGELNVTGNADFGDKVTLRLSNVGKMTVDGTVTNAGTLAITNSEFSADKVVNTGYFYVAGNSGKNKITIGDLDGELELGNCNVVYSNITDKAGTTAGIVKTANDAKLFGLNTINATIQNDVSLTVSANATLTGANIINKNNGTAQAPNYALLSVAGVLDGVTVNGGVITTTAGFTFAGASALNGATITNEGATITVTNADAETLSVDTKSALTLNKITFGDDKSTITINAAEGFTGTKMVIDLAVVDGQAKLANIQAGTGLALGYDKVGNDYYVAKIDPSVAGQIEVNAAWNGSAFGADVYATDETKKGKFYYGFNAFSTLADAINNIGTDTTTISVASSYVAVPAVLEGNLTVKSGVTVQPISESATANVSIAFKPTVTTPAYADYGLLFEAGSTLASNVNITTVAGDAVPGVEAADAAWCATVYVNSNNGPASVTVNGNIKSAGHIYFRGAANVAGNLEVPHGTEAEDRLVLLRAGKANAADATANAKVIIGRAAGNTDTTAQVKGAWITLISGDAEFNNTVIDVSRLGYDNYSDDAKEYKFKPTLTSNNTKWSINMIDLEKTKSTTTPKNAAFIFNGNTVTVATDVKLGKMIELSLNGADMTAVNVSNAGTINLSQNSALEAKANVTGTVTNVAGGVINVGKAGDDQKSELTAKTIKNSGTLNVKAGSTVTATASGSRNGGTINIGAADETEENVLSITGVLENAGGKINVTKGKVSGGYVTNWYGTSELNLENATFNSMIDLNQGTVKAVNSTLSGAHFKNSGTYVVLTTDGKASSIKATDDTGINNAAGANFRVNAAADKGDLTLSTDKTKTTLTGKITNAGTMEVNTATLNGSIENTGSFTMIGGSITGSTVTTAADAEFNASGALDLNIANFFSGKITLGAATITKSTAKGYAGEDPAVAAGTIETTASKTVTFVDVNDFSNVEITNNGAITVTGSLTTKSIDGGSVNVGGKLRATTLNTALTITAGPAAAAADVAVSVSGDGSSIKGSITLDVGTALDDADKGVYVSGTLSDITKVKVKVGETTEEYTFVNGVANIGNTGYALSNMGGAGISIAEKQTKATLTVGNYKSTDTGFGFNKFNRISAALGSIADETESLVIQEGYTPETMTDDLLGTFKKSATISGKAIAITLGGKELILSADGLLTISNDITVTNGNVVLNYGQKSASYVTGNLLADKQVQIDGNATVNGKITAGTLLWLRNGKESTTVTDVVEEGIALNNTVSAETVLISSGKVTTASETISATSLIVGTYVPANNGEGNADRRDDKTGKATTVVSNGSTWTFASNMLATGSLEDSFTLNGGKITFAGGDSSIHLDKKAVYGDVGTDKEVADDTVLIENKNFTLNLNKGADLNAVKISNAGTINLTGIPANKIDDTDVPAEFATLTAANVVNTGTIILSSTAILKTTAGWGLNNQGTIKVADGSILNAAQMDNTASGKLIISGATVNGGDIDNAGSFVITGASQINNTNIRHTAKLEQGSLTDSVIKNTQNNGKLVIAAKDETEAAAANVFAFNGTNTIASAIENNGTMNVNGTLTSGALTNNSALKIVAGSDVVLTVNGALANAGAITIDTSALTLQEGQSVKVITVNGALTGNGTIVADNTAYDVMIKETIDNEVVTKTEVSLFYKGGIIVDKTTLAVNYSWKGSKNYGDDVIFGQDTEGQAVHYRFGINAFDSANELVNLTSETKAIKFATSAVSYGNLTLNNSTNISVWSTDGLDQGGTLALGTLAIDGSATATTPVEVNFNKGDLNLGGLSVNKARVNFGEESVNNNTTITGNVVITDADIDFDDITTITGNVTISGASEVEFDRKTTINGKFEIGAGSVVEADQGFGFTINNTEDTAAVINGQLLVTSKDKASTTATYTDAKLGKVTGTGKILTDVNSALSWDGFNGETNIDVTGLKRGGTLKSFALLNKGAAATFTATGTNADTKAAKYFAYAEGTGLTQIALACNVIDNVSDDATLDTAISDGGWDGFDGVHYYTDNIVINAGNYAQGAAAILWNNAWDGTATASVKAPAFTIKDGAKFKNMVLGGKKETTAASGYNFKTLAYNDTNITIDGGNFNNSVVAGDAVMAKGFFVRQGNTNLTINGGTFGKNSKVAAGMLYYNKAVTSLVVVENTNLTITGGEFNNKVYGGNFAAYNEGSNCTVINGYAKVTIETGKNDIILNDTLVVGSYGSGVIEGGTVLTLKGKTAQSAKTYTVSIKEIFGGCGNDYYSKADREYVTTMNPEAKRTLSFTGFDGALNCDKIRGFSDVSVKSNGKELGDDDRVDTKATLNDNAFGLADVSNWTFEAGSSLLGEFQNDFAGDKLALTGITAETKDWQLFNATGFTGADTLKVSFNGGDLVAYNDVLGGWANGNDYMLSASNWTYGLQSELKKDAQAQLS